MTASAKPSSSNEPLSIGDLAKQALTEHDGAVDTAVEALVERLLDDRELLRHLLAQIVRGAATYWTRRGVRVERSRIIHLATSGPASVRALAGGIAASLLDMPLGGGVRLRACDRATVQRESERYAVLASDCGRKARFLGLIARNVPEGGVVGDAISDARAFEFWSEAGR